MNTTQFVSVHLHLYQPGGRRKHEPSASPDSNWTWRVWRECYEPLSQSWFIDSAGQRQALNCYEWASFNIGPTLWNELSEKPEGRATLARIIEGDKASVRRFGHGCAIGQCYNHVIMPLASWRDKVTQVKWAQAHFKHNFGRLPQGMWLPETAVDDASLEALAQENVNWVLLAPRQAKAWRPLGGDSQSWQYGDIDPSRPYLCRLRSGRTINVFFYDGPISQAIAFEGLLNSSEKFRDRLLSGFNAGRNRPQLVSTGTDGESFGHHHKFGNLALSNLINLIGQNKDVSWTNYTRFLAENPPQAEVMLHENSSWSCAHGVERWRSDCGCHDKPGYHQRWRGPLRNSLNVLKAHFDDLFEMRGRDLFCDPWRARNNYIQVMLDPSCQDTFLANEDRSLLTGTQRRQALALLEMQKLAMQMFTSCGWFFSEISDLEATGNLITAALALEVARVFFGEDYEPEFTKLLAAAESNRPEYQNGLGIWNQMILPESEPLKRELIARLSA